MSRRSLDAACRACHSSPIEQFLSLGDLPLPDALLRVDQVDGPESRYPLDVAFCPACSLVQLVGDVPAEKLFVENYHYFSSFSDAVLDHSRDHAMTLVDQRSLGENSLVVEVASNDGYLLRNFVEAGIPALGIDPSPGPAAAAREAGVATLEEFFGVEVADRLVSEGHRADVIIANNVMAHVPDLDDFVGGLARLVAVDGLITVENPSVGELIDRCAFDTIYHEHTCYYSSTSVDRLVARHGLFLNHVESFPDLHGGTLRWHISRRAGRSEQLEEALAAEAERGLTDVSYYEDFGERVQQLRRQLLELLTELKEDGRSIAAYGAAAKGSVLLNYVGIDRGMVDLVVDRNPHKQGMHMPGTHHPIHPVEALLERQPDYTLLLSWNFADEILRQQAEYRRRGGRFVSPIPTPEVLA